MKMNLNSAFLALVGFSTVALVSSVDSACKDVWAHHDPMDVCLEPIGAPYWGWTNGRYGISGSSCDECDCPDCPTSPPTPQDPPTSPPTPTPVPLPVACGGVSGQWSGDPHFKTFDGLRYDCQGEGEFHVLKSLDSDFEIQGRFIKFRPDKRPTVTKSVTWFSGDDVDPLIQVTTPDTPVAGSCLPEIRVDKELVEDPTATPFLYGTVQIAYAEKGNGKLQGYIFYHHNSGLQVQIFAKTSSANGCVLSAQYCLPDSWERSSETFVGLLGTPDGDKSNDWPTRDGGNANVPTSKKGLKFAPAYEWCRNWCVNSAQESLFYYEQDESYVTYDHCDLPPDTETEACVDDPIEELANVCGDDLSCLVDGCAGGVEEAKDFLVVEAEMKDVECGKEIYLETFDGADVEDTWGKIEKGSYDSYFVTLEKSNPRVKKTVDGVPVDADMLEIEFLLLEVGDWEGKGKNKDYVFLHVGDTKLDLLEFDGAVSKNNPEEFFEGFSKGITWSRRAVTDNHQNFGLREYKGGDQLHKVTVKVPPSYYQDGTLDLKWEADVTGNHHELVGFDDVRITAYGEACDIPGSTGIKQEDSCGEQVLFEDFEGQASHHWGTMETEHSQTYLRLDSKSKKVRIDHIKIPSKAEVTDFEFMVYRLGDWSFCAPGEKCKDTELKVKIDGKEIAKIDTFTNGNPTSSGNKGNVEWTRSVVGDGILKIQIHIPFHKKDLKVELEAHINGSRMEGIGIGIDDVRAVAFSKECVHVHNNRRRLLGFLDSYRPALDDQLSRGLVAGAEADDCQCLCPTLPNENPTPGSPSAPVVMALYYSAHRITCDPQGLQVGTVTMTQQADGLVRFDYSVDPSYQLQEVSIHVGAERLPWDTQGNFLPEDDFPYAEAASGTTATVIVDPLVCDYYAAVHAQICGAFPLTEPPSMFPTRSPSGSPTIVPTAFPTTDPTGIPTKAPSSAPTTLSPSVASGHPSAAATTGTPTAAPTKADTIEPTKSATDAPTGSPKTPPPVTQPPKTESPTNTPPGSYGDPHVLTWGGDAFDFHGGCDLVLVDNPGFHDGLGMSIHIRTKIVTWWSYIHTAVIHIGNETLEVTGGNEHKFFVNGAEGDNSVEDFRFSPLGLKVKVKQATAHQLKVRIDLLNADAIGFEVFKTFVRVNIKMIDPKWKKFQGSNGLMGMYPTGATIGRDGKTAFTDMNAFGQEWQVLESEPKLFRTVDGPQHPTKCIMPEHVSMEQKKRRLGEAMISQEDAETACARVDPGSRGGCIFDVLATNDMEMAGSY